MMKTIKITYCGETVTLTADLAQASSPLLVDGKAIGYQTADARHYTALAVVLAANAVWPTEQWPDLPSGGMIPDGWGDDSEAWAELSYETVQ